MPKLIESLNPEVAKLLAQHPFQDQSTDIIVDAQLPRMAADPAKEPLKPAVGRLGHVLAAMPAKVADTPQRVTNPPTAGSNDRVMPQFIIGPETARDGKPLAAMRPQKEMQPHTIAATRADGYVRMRVRVTDDRMRILNVTSVEGPLAQPTSIVGEHAYEVTLDNNQLAAEGIADIGVQRSYPRPGEHEHHMTELTSYEFNVRVPRSALPEGAVERLNINLYRLPDAKPKPIQGAALLSRQLGPQAQLVARIEGLRPEHIDPAAIDQFTKVFPSVKLR
jgi:hypothetical protein